MEHDPAGIPTTAPRMPSTATDASTLMAPGLGNQEFAEPMVVSEATVKTHVARILGKLQVENRVQAVVVAYESRLVTPNG